MRFAESFQSTPRRRDVGISIVAAGIGLGDRPLRAIIAKLRLLIDTRGFPAPLTPRFVKGAPRTGSAAVHALSRWDRDAVEAWRDASATPAEAAARARRASEATRAGLAERARGLVA